MPRVPTFARHPRRSSTYVWRQGSYRLFAVASYCLDEYEVPLVRA
jgi:hypothetical protein